MPSAHDTVDAALAEVRAMNEAMAAVPSESVHAMPILDAGIERVVSLVGGIAGIQAACDLLSASSGAVREKPDSIPHRERLNGALEGLAQELRALRELG